MITWLDISNMTKTEWLLSRNKSIGASEVGTILVGSNFTSNLELFYQKIGMGKPTEENIAMSMGKKTEPISIQYWRHYNGTEQSAVVNEREGRIIKECRLQNMTCFNSKYPHLSATPDSRILPYGIYEGMGEGNLEIKNTVEYVLKSYEGGLPVANVLQLATQNMMSESLYGEIFYMLLDSRRFECHQFLRKHTKKTEESIIAHTTDFWNRVMKARPLVNQRFEALRKPNMKLASELLAEIQNLEPGVQNTRGYMDFLTKMYKDRSSGAGVIQGTDPYLVLARKRKTLKSKMEKLEKEVQLIEIEMKRVLKDHNVIDFGSAGKITYFSDENNSRRLQFKIK